MFLPWWGILFIIFIIALVGSALNHQQSEEISKLQQGIDEIKEQLSEVREKLDDLKPEEKTLTYDRGWAPISDQTRQIMFEKIYDPSRPKPVPEPGWRMGPRSYSEGEAKTLEQSLAPHYEAVKLVPDPLLPGRYYVLTKPKTSELPNPNNPMDDSHGRT
jgi:hypothetical protein